SSRSSSKRSKSRWQWVSINIFFNHSFDPLFRHPHTNHLTTGCFLTVSIQGGGHNHLPSLHFLGSRAHSNCSINRCGAEVINMQRGGDKAHRRLAVHGTPFGAISSRRSRSRAVTIDQRGDESAIDEARNRRVIRARLIAAHCFTILPIALNLQAILVQPSTAITVAG